jgi:hypothetical protein
LVTSRWPDRIRVTLVGLGDGLELIAPDRVTIARSLDEALPELERRGADLNGQLSAWGIDDVLTGRSVTSNTDAWAPHYLITAVPPTPEQTERLLAAARTRHRAGDHVQPAAVLGGPPERGRPRLRARLALQQDRDGPGRRGRPGSQHLGPAPGRRPGDPDQQRLGRVLYGVAMAPVRQFQVTFDCAEPERVARFWCEVLGYVAPPPEGFATWDDFNRTLPPAERGSWFACTDPSGAGPRLYFQRVPEGKAAKNRLHLDVRVGTGLVGEERLAALEAECARLIPLGAVRVRLLPADDDNESCLVMQDIEGNEFCLD